MFTENLPFPRGTTFYGSNTPSLTDASSIALEGKEYFVDDASSPPPVGGTNALGGTTLGLGGIWLRCVRNVSGIALSAKRLVTFKSGFEYRRVDGYSRLPNVLCFPIDDSYGSLTIPNNDLCYIVTAGPCLINDGVAADATNNFSVGDLLASLTAATSQAASTAGRIGAGTFAITGNTGIQALQDIYNQVGRALTARTTSNTGTDTLVMVAHKW